MLQGMEGSSLGVWVAHGEGRAYFPSRDVLNVVLENNLAPLSYVDEDNNATMEYPFNPNGSVDGIAGKQGFVSKPQRISRLTSSLASKRYVLRMEGILP